MAILRYSFVPIARDLRKVQENDEVIYYESFIMTNPLSNNEFPKNDIPYYQSLDAQLYHLLYKYDKGWITSERQLIYHSDECISAVHFLLDEDKFVKKINVFQRSSNINNLEEDVQFFNYFIKEWLPNPEDIELTIFVSAPHEFKNKKNKVEEVE